MVIGYVCVCVVMQINPLMGTFKTAEQRAYK